MLLHAAPDDPTFVWQYVVHFWLHRLVAMTSSDAGFSVLRNDAIWPPKIVVVTRAVVRTPTATTTRVKDSAIPFIIELLALPLFMLADKNDAGGYHPEGSFKSLMNP